MVGRVVREGVLITKLGKGGRWYMTASSGLPRSGVTFPPRTGGSGIFRVEFKVDHVWQCGEEN